MLLINTWGEDTLQQELRMTHRTGHIFTIISNKMAAQGFSRTPEQCQTRLKRLKLNFRQSYHNKCVCSRQETLKEGFSMLVNYFSLFLHPA